MDTDATDTNTLSLHDALPISSAAPAPAGRSPERAARPQPRRAPPRALRGRPPSPAAPARRRAPADAAPPARDRKSTRLNSSHVAISYAVFCLKKKNTKYEA